MERTTRRAFLGSSALALPLLRVNVAAQRRDPEDALTDALQLEFKDATKELIDRPSGEAARRMALTLRLATKHGPMVAADRQLRAALRRANRADVLRTELTEAMYLAEARAFGITPPPFRGGSAPFETRERVLEALLRDGLTGYLTTAAGVLDDVGAAIDQRGPVRPVQLSRCERIETLTVYAEVTAAIACAFGGPWGCMYAMGVYWGLRLEYRSLGC
jgi:hypothetical protein